MRTQTQHTAYTEALSIITSLGASVDGAFDTVRLGRSGERWSILFGGVRSPQANSLLRLFSAVTDGTLDIRDDYWIVRVYKGRSGRVDVTIHLYEHVVKRIDGRTGQSIPQEGLW